MVEPVPVDCALMVGVEALCMQRPLGGATVPGSGSVTMAGVMGEGRGGRDGGRGEDGLFSSCCSSSMFRDLYKQQLLLY